MKLALVAADHLDHLAGTSPPMLHLPTIRLLLDHNDWSNDRILDAAAPLSDNQLDAPFDMGPGSLRRTLIHTQAGEEVWLKRLKGVAETPWPDEGARIAVAALAEQWRVARLARDAHLATLEGTDLSRIQPYRDSRGTLYRASLAAMILQPIHHSIHHRAQLVNMLRRVGAKAPELDYMYRARVPA
jgi:uncharacterized damage-inducible protein DinB